MPNLLSTEELRLLRWRLSQPHAQPLDVHVALSLIDMLERGENEEEWPEYNDYI